MAILSDKIKSAAQGVRDKLRNQPVGIETERARQGMAARSGKAATGPSGQSNVAEKLAAKDAEFQGEQVAQNLEGQADAAVTAEAAAESQQRMFDAGQRAATLEADANYSQAIDSELNKFEQFSMDMSEAEEDLALEKLGFQMALKDKQYMARLDQQARLARLEDDIAYKQEVADQIMGEEYARTMRELGFMENEHDLDMQNIDKLASMDINSAMAAANAAIQDDIRMQKSQAWSSLGSSGAQVISGLDNKGVFDKKSPTTTPTNNVDAPNTYNDFNTKNTV